MRFLHTADWHVGKKLGRIDRLAEFAQAMDEIVAITRDQKVDVVLVAGDILDRSFAPLDAISLVVEGLRRLADAAGTVIAMPGNHDSAQLFELLRPLLSAHGVMLIPKISRPEAGGVVTVGSRDGKESASVGVLPFLHEAAVVDFMEKSEEWFKGYADRIRLLSSALCNAFDAKNVGILVGHWFIEGAELGGGERRIHLGDQYAATAQAIPPGAAYVALGHIHRPQEIVGAAVRTRYSGSLLQLDFSERTHTKEVVIIDAVAGRPAKVVSIQLTSGRKLIRVEDTLESLREKVGSWNDAYLDVRVKTSGPVFGIAEQVREFLPNAVLVQAVYEREVGVAHIGGHDLERSLTDVYAEYHASEQGHAVAAPAELVDLLRSLEDEVLREAS